MSDRNSGEWLSLTEKAPEVVWKRLNAAQVGLGNLAKQAFALGFQEVEIPQFVDAYAEVTAPSAEVPELNGDDLRKVINQEAPGSDQFAGRYSGVSGGQGNAQEAL